MKLETFGLTPSLIEQNTRPFEIGRVISLNRTYFKVQTEQQQYQATLAGRLANVALEAIDFPTVGDWVCLHVVAGTAVIERILPRTSLFVRKGAGKTSASQLVAANIDVVLVCMALDHNYNLRRLERYLAVAHASGAKPVIVLTKADKARDVAAQQKEVAALAPGIPVIVVNAYDAVGVAPLADLMQPRFTYALIGSSGVGKSTLVNRLLHEEAINTQAVRQNDDHGRHTTTGREMFVLPSGAIVIDTPGMRELGLIDADIDTTFEDIMALAQDCRFRDCTHTKEPGCAVLAAIKAGTLSPERLHSYQQLNAEAAQNTALRGRAREQAKIQRMFGSKKQMKQVIQRSRRKHH